MALPEIPDEAVEAACMAEADVVYGQEGFSRRQAMIPVASVRAGLHAALPHLYAAALRHAAENVLSIEVLLERHGVATNAEPYHVAQAWRKELRALADEAVRDA
jgi:hypothetical protein